LYIGVVFLWTKPVGKKTTSVFARISIKVGDKWDTDTVRDFLGLTVKFFIEKGNQGFFMTDLATPSRCTPIFWTNKFRMKLDIVHFTGLLHQNKRVSLFMSSLPA